MPTLAEIRQQYPQYNDMPDTALADALHKKFYGDMPRADFDAKIGLAPADTTGSTGTVNAFTGGAIEGIPIIGPAIKGGTERAAAGIRSVMQGTPYADELKAVQDYAGTAAKEHPTAHTVGEVTGGVGSMVGAAIPATGARLLGLTGTLPQMIGRGAASGAAINAVDAGVRGNDPVADVGLGGAVGGAVGAAAPVLGRVANMLAQPVISTVRGILNPAQEASRRVAGAVQRDVQAGTAGFNDAEFAAQRAAGTPVNLMDMGGETTRALARSAANTSPEGRAVLNRSIDDRFEGQSERLTSWLRSTFHYPDAPAQQAALAQLGRTVNRDAYRLATTAAENRHPAGIWSPELERLTSSPDVVDAMRGAAERGAGRAVAEGFGGFNPGVTFDQGMVNFRRGASGVPTYPDLRFWDYSYRNLRDAADQAFRTGRNSEGGALRAQSNQLRTELDRMVPEFGQARGGAARFFQADDALEAGQNYVNLRLGNRETRQALLRMAPEERQLFQDGFVDRMVQDLRASPDRRSMLNRIANSPAEREKLNIALGPQRAQELEAMLRVEGIMDLARPAVQGNSTTARQLTELGLAGGANFIEGGGSFSADPQALLHSALVYGAARGHRTIDHRVARQVAQLLASNDPARLRMGMQMLARNSNLMGAVRNADAALAAVAARGLLPAIGQ